MEIRVIGGLAVRFDGAGLALGTPKQQLVLAMLALHVGRLVTVDELVDELWPQAPPRSAVPNVRTYAANLRRSLNSAGDGRVAIVREPGGYRLHIDEDRIDLHRLSPGWHDARNMADQGRPIEAIPLLAEVVDAWSGPLLAGLPLGPGLTARREAVDRDRQSAVELLAELRLRTDRADLALPLLRAHASRYPLREPAQALLMRALIGTHDVSGALAVYQAARDALAAQLGVPPGPELERVHRATLDARRARRRPAGGPVEAAAVGRNEDAGRGANWLPRVVPDFVGRREVIERTLGDIAADEAGPVVRVIDGMAGCGKTTLAVHLAHRLADRFPGGQLFVDLGGHAEGAPVPPASALVTLLRQLGLPAGRIPGELPDRIEMWRRELALRRAVVVLDNAADSAQVEPLLPATGRAVVLVTSRRRLLALTERPPVSLSVLPESEALALLTSLVGEQRVRADPDGASEMVRICGGLPLAIRLAGTRLAHRPAWTMSDMVRRLSGKPAFLPRLQAEARTVVEAFAESYEPLDSSARRVFRSLGLVAAGHYDTAMVGALTDLPLDEAADLIDELVDRHLVEEIADGRYRLHDLMRQYAYELSLQTDPEPIRKAVVAGLLDHLLHSVVVVSAPMEEKRLVDRNLRLEAPLRPDLLSARLPGDLEWLEEQRLNLNSLVRQAAREGHEAMAWRLARAAWRFFYMRSYFDDISATHGEGLVAARRTDDRHAVALMHNYLASACVRTGAYQEASAHLHEVVSIRAELGDVEGTDRARVNLGVVYWLTGRIQDSLDVNQAAVRAGALDTLPVLPNLGLTLRFLGRHDESMAVHRLHLFVARVRGDLFHLSNALGHLGGVRYRLGHDAQAERLLRASLALRDRTGNGYARAETLSDLAGTYRHLGRLDEALRHHHAAIEAAANAGERHVQAEARNELAMTLRVAGRQEESVAMFRQALDIATRIAHPYEQGRALSGLAEHLADNDPEDARRYRRRALAIFERMGVPEQHEIRRLLAEVSPDRV
ncbi:BTAD domain-containing putative transcriptional regulator [Micromonospora chaiyaphumensis]|uniref:DNA-binding transcriptional activator of the SARP family n=1 Tax=Micromonospora chaiyaphumensis TaxID=307119 RepID=A0A1C4XTE5_9ACTN|nr:BTAD domain-containing putative transcriptional regulator [Micromonospora chaiyaphumensis]SCF11789.1 DNA-binding transcriptional activator of the SARP family [Micromonospora chaiyaphumensis]